MGFISYKCVSPDVRPSVQLYAGGGFLSPSFFLVSLTGTTLFSQKRGNRGPNHPIAYMIFKCSSSQDSLLVQVNKWFIQLCNSQIQTGMYYNRVAPWHRRNVKRSQPDYTCLSCNMVAWYHIIIIGWIKKSEGKKGVQYRKGKCLFP